MYYKGADQNAWMHRLVCIFVVHMQQIRFSCDEACIFFIRLLPKCLSAIRLVTFKNRCTVLSLYCIPHYNKFGYNTDVFRLPNVFTMDVYKEIIGK